MLLGKVSFPYIEGPTVLLLHLLPDDLIGLLSPVGPVGLVTQHFLYGDPRTRYDTVYSKDFNSLSLCVKIHNYLNNNASS